MSTLIEPIRADLHLSDSAIGFLTGVALARFLCDSGQACPWPRGRSREPAHDDRARSRHMVGHDRPLRGRAQFLAAVARADQRSVWVRRGARRLRHQIGLGLFSVAATGARLVGVFGGRLVRRCSDRARATPAMRGAGGRPSCCSRCPASSLRSWSQSRCVSRNAGDSMSYRRRRGPACSTRCDLPASNRRCFTR